MSKVTIALLVAVALLMFVAGWFAGRRALEREWSNPVSVVTAEDVKRASAVKDADPPPAAGTRILKALPLRKMRELAKSFTEKDPVVMAVGSWGRGDGYELHLSLKNRGDCKTKRIAGVAYGYDAWGRPVSVSKSGDHYFAFDVSKEAEIEPNDTNQISAKATEITTASLAVAHVDLVECEGGKVWKRQ